EIRRKVMRDQLGLDAGAADEPATTAKGKTVKRGERPPRKEPISRKPSEQGRTRNMARSEADRKAKAKAEPMGRGKGATKTFGKQHGRPDRAEADMYDEREDGWSYGKPKGRPGTKQTGRPTGSPAGKPTGRPIGKPGGKPFGRPAGSSTGKPAGRPSGKPFGKPRGPNNR
ncbi:MAG TPA: hypothetical protein DE314_09910, partial [Sulfitobacter sp.]|nr:hypothetical protein [Sulfitobacter sp.]